MRGRFITIEGGEGAGKSTCLSTVVNTLQDHGIDVITTREPGGTELAEEIRALLLANRETGVDPVTELMLMFTARHDHLQTVIRPALDRGTWVVCDRFTDATYAYQGGGRGVDRSRIEDLEAFVQQGLQPDLTLLLDVPPETGLSRALKDRQADRFETEKIDFYERVRQGLP